MSDFPAALDNLPKPGPEVQQDDPDFYHDVGHVLLAQAIEAVQAKLGIDGDASATTVDFATRGMRALTVQESRNLAPADAGMVLEIDATEQVILTVAADADVAIPVGSVIEVFQFGVGAVRINPANGVTLRSSVDQTTGRTLAGRYASASVRKRAANDWTLLGGLE